MTSIRIWATAARPKTLILVLCPIMIGTVLSLSRGYFHPPILALTLLTGLGIQISTNLANDYFDFLKGADTKERLGPLRVTQAGLVSPTSMKKAVISSLLLTAIIGSFLLWQGGMAAALLLAASLALSVAYTAGPFPLAYLGLGEVFVFAFFGPIATGFTTYLQCKAFYLDAFIAGIGPGAIATAVIIVNNLRDVEQDLLANKKTLIVRFGKAFGKWEYACCFLLAALTPLFFFHSHPLALLSLVFLLPALKQLRTVISSYDPIQLNLCLAKTAQLTFVYSVLFSFGWMI